MEMERVAFFNLSIYMDHDSHAEVLGWVGATGTNVPYKARCHHTTLIVTSQCRQTTLSALPSYAQCMLR